MSVERASIAIAGRFAIDHWLGLRVAQRYSKSLWLSAGHLADPVHANRGP